MRQTMRRWLHALTAVALVSSAVAAAAQDFPSRQVRIVVPQSPGGVTDVIARAVAQRLSETWGQPVIVENKAGANYQIGANFVAKAEPDGYTLLVMSEAFAINPLLSAKLPYDPVKDFAPVTGLISINHALVAHPSLPANSVKELIELARAKPGEINYGTYGVGSTGHLNMEMFQSRAGVKLFPVHYKGAAPALTDVMAGHIPLMFISVSSVVEPAKAGKVKLLGIGSAQRLPALPEVPTIAESALAGLPRRDLVRPVHHRRNAARDRRQDQRRRSAHRRRSGLPRALPRAADVRAADELAGAIRRLPQRRDAEVGQGDPRRECEGGLTMSLVVPARGPRRGTRRGAP